mmetsp:Transcript_43073/g.82579  ORF Transcript_43073/g.82579 Transcript_43073/m.82579 type:complete len:102 (-) Transcript_43073:17-322(-)
MWCEQENSCPLCKQRFAQIGVYGTTGELVRVSRVEERDQDFEGDEGSDDDDMPCRACGEYGDDRAILLCDGNGGRCDDHKAEAVLHLPMFLQHLQHACGDM